jgi:hypothetical protein
MSYLRYLCLFVHSDVQHIYCVVVLFSFSSSCVPCCHHLVYPAAIILCTLQPVSLDRPFLIVLSVFSNVYLPITTTFF